MNIVIIGGGQLGSRHLQGLALLEQELNIYIVDPSQQALIRCEERFKEVDNLHNKKLHFLNEIKNLPSKIEMAIISTTSKYRLNSIEVLMSQCSVKYLILEKFLFPSEEEYKKAQKIIGSSTTLAYVNCSRRLLTGYQLIKEQVAGLQFEMKVIGDNWNLASNAIHFVDLFSYLNGNAEFDFNNENANLLVTDSKHIGYIEFFGHINTTAINGSSLELLCNNNSVPKLHIEIKCEESTYIVDEVNNVLEVNTEKKPFPMLFQSQMTNLLFEQLIEHGICDLVDFEESAKMHIKLLKLFNDFSGDREGIVT